MVPRSSLSVVRIVRCGLYGTDCTALELRRNLIEQFEQAMRAYQKGLEIDPIDTRAIKSLLKAKDQIQASRS